MTPEKEKATASIADAIASTVSHYFAQLGARDEVYSTSDGYVFENAGFARDHARTLEDKNVTPHKNAKSIEVVDEETADDIVLNEEQKELLNTGLVKENYAAIKALIKVLGITTADQKAETLIAALTAYKDSL